MPDREKVIKGLQNLRDAIATDYIHEADQAIGTIDNALSLLKEQPEIVRCKECVYWQDNNDGYPHIGCKWREDETPDPDDFCSAGEMK